MATQQLAFRTCPTTGFKVHLRAEKLIVANAVTAVVFLTLGGIMALLIALTRWEAVHLLSADWYYRLLGAHGMTMLVYWIVFFEIAGLYFGGAVVLNSRLPKPGLGWLAFALMLTGAVMSNVMVLIGQATVMFTAYVPLKAHPLYYLGVVLFAVGAFIAVGLFFASLVVAKVEKRYEGSLPLFTYGLMAAAIIAVFTLVGGVITFVPALLWSLGIFKLYDPGAYRVFFWAFGHPAQQVNLAAMVAIWYALSSLMVGAKPVNEKLSRVAFLLYILFINLGSIHHLLVDPGLHTADRILNTSYFFYLAVVGSMIHAFSIPAGIEIAQRAKGYTHGIFQWLIKAPWKEPGFSALVISMVLFGFLGGVTGVLQGTMQLNILVHNTLRVPAHFHMTVVAGTTLAFMGISYYLIPLMVRRNLVGKAWASVQPYIYGGGLALLFFGMYGAGSLGVPRRTWDTTYSQSIVPGPVFGGEVNIFLALLGIGAVIAVIGGAIFVILMVLTLFFGKKVPIKA
ncbi:MAG: cytochrome c oxidase subunit I [Dehalococcoidia bacterium]|nr:cytochrome c oxidase subunit I [Dehalococcoidia bacterium]MBF8304260.1 cytochrome c oxidase subunit [Dehalococcoidia bacterium]